MLISAMELNKRLQDPDTLIIDVRDWHNYLKGHIPRAVNLDLFAFHWADTSEEGIESFNKQASIILSSVGISYDKFVVFYEDISGILAARGLWLLHYFSHNNVAILDGGFNIWKEKHYPVEKKATVPSPSRFEPKINRDVLATYQYILENINKVTIVDARSKEEYEGKSIRAARGGHIPTSINVNWENNIEENGKLKSTKELSRIYEIKDNEVICYCQGGYRAANTYLALKSMGLKNVRVYLGSWYEWGNRPDLPIEI